MTMTGVGRNILKKKHRLHNYFYVSDIILDPYQQNTS